MVWTSKGKRKAFNVLVGSCVILLAACGESYYPVYTTVDKITTSSISELRAFKRACLKTYKNASIRLKETEDGVYAAKCITREII